MEEREKDKEELRDGSGRKEHQRMKHFLVYMYLLKNTDEEHPAKAETIANFLIEQGIYAERRSIYKDIEELNLAYLLMNDPDCFHIEDAQEMLDEDEELACIKFKFTKPKGFYMSRRPLEPENARLLAECVYNARFIPDSTEKILLKDIGYFLSKYQKKSIKQEVYLVDRVATNNKEITFNVQEINRAIKDKCAISFKYLKHEITYTPKEAERRRGGGYKVSPYHVVINGGNYYLLGLNEKQKITTYRIDRMKHVKMLEEPREETEESKELMRDIKTYSKRVFAMYGGERQTVELRFINLLLDTVIDRFGTVGTTYSKVDENHFSVRTSVEVSEQFFAWVCGFGKRAKIVRPESVVKQFKEYLEKIYSMY